MDKPEKIIDVSNSSSASEPACQAQIDLGERRERHERRTLSWRAFMYGFWKPRRRNARRSAADGVPLVDTFQPAWLFVTTLIVLLSVTDAFFTLHLLGNGAEEINPIMDHLIRLDQRAFLLGKVLLTVGGCLLLNRIGYFRLFNRFRVRQVFLVILLTYMTLIIHELIMLFTAS